MLKNTIYACRLVEEINDTLFFSIFCQVQVKKKQYYGINELPFILFGLAYSI